MEFKQKALIEWIHSYWPKVPIDFKSLYDGVTIARLLNEIDFKIFSLAGISSSAASKGVQMDNWLLIKDNIKSFAQKVNFTNVEISDIDFKKQLEGSFEEAITTLISYTLVICIKLNADTHVPAIMALSETSQTILQEIIESVLPNVTMQSCLMESTVRKSIRQSILLDDRDEMLKKMEKEIARLEDEKKQNINKINQLESDNKDLQEKLSAASISVLKQSSILAQKSVLELHHSSENLGTPENDIQAQKIKEEYEKQLNDITISIENCKSQIEVLTAQNLEIPKLKKRLNELQGVNNKLDETLNTIQNYKIQIKSLQTAIQDEQCKTASLTTLVANLNQKLLVSQEKECKAADSSQSLAQDNTNLKEEIVLLKERISSLTNRVSSVQTEKSESLQEAQIREEYEQKLSEYTKHIELVSKTDNKEDLINKCINLEAKTNELEREIKKKEQIIQRNIEQLQTVKAPTTPDSKLTSEIKELILEIKAGNTDILNQFKETKAKSSNENTTEITNKVLSLMEENKNLHADKQLLQKVIDEYKSHKPILSINKQKICLYLVKTNQYGTMSRQGTNVFKAIADQIESPKLNDSINKATNEIESQRKELALNFTQINVGLSDMLKLLNTLISSNSNILNQLLQLSKTSDSNNQHQSSENSSLNNINQSIKSIEGLIKEESGSLLAKFGKIFDAVGSKPSKVHDHFALYNSPLISVFYKPKPTHLKSIVSLSANIHINAVPQMQMHDSSHIQDLKLKDEIIWKLKSSLTKLISVLKPKGEGLLQASKDIMLMIQKFK